MRLGQFIVITFLVTYLMATTEVKFNGGEDFSVCLLLWMYNRRMKI